LTKPTPVAPQQKTEQYSNIYLLFLVHTMKEWN
jgi:hypothetical protein